MDDLPIDEILALDATCLRNPDGGPLDLATHRAQLETSLTRARIVAVRRNTTLVAYAYIRPLDETRWFVGGLAIHPAHRNASVTVELFRSVQKLIAETGAAELHSHVLTTDTQSIRLHHRLGFTETQRSDHAIAFSAQVADLAKRSW